eukprot:PhM_4_TR16079/c9_g1_i1/m.94295
MSTEPSHPSTCVLWLSVRRALGLGECDSFEPWSTRVSSALRRFEPSFQHPTTFTAFRVRECVLGWLRRPRGVCSLTRSIAKPCGSRIASVGYHADVTNVDRWCLYEPHGIYEAVSSFFLRFDKGSQQPLAAQLMEWVKEDLAGLVDVMFTLDGTPLLHFLRFMDGCLQRAMYKRIVVTEGQHLADAFFHESRSYNASLPDWIRSYHVVAARCALTAAGPRTSSVSPTSHSTSAQGMQ